MTGRAGPLRLCCKRKQQSCALRAEHHEGSARRKRCPPYSSRVLSLYHHVARKTLRLKGEGVREREDGPYRCIAAEP